MDEAIPTIIGVLVPLIIVLPIITYFFGYGRGYSVAMQYASERIRSLRP